LKIKWIGHACFAITASDGTVIVTDPYEPGAYDGALGYGPIPVSPDIATVSHGHEDHGYVQGLQGKPTVIKQGGPSEAKGIKFDMYSVFHDTSRGGERGTNAIICFTIDGVRLCHLGDLGHLLDAATVQAIMHYKTDKCGFPIETVDPFVQGKPDVERPGATEFDVEKDNLPAATKIVVLEHAA
jgi:L-ascorbate metabolism protein UlaG (beta-lactamase superfamily)